MEYGEIDMNPDFQRSKDLWDAGTQSRLIESILLGLPLPAFYFDTTKKDKWLIIDGLQRCCSVFNFCVNKKMPLVELEFLHDLENKTFDELDRALQRSIITRPITVNLLKDTSNKVRYVLFKRLNTAGLVLSPQEIRNAIYGGQAMDIIKQMAKQKSFEEFLKMNHIKIDRMQDCDYATRFVSFYLTNYNEYKPNMDDFLNSAMEKLGNLNKIKIESLVQQFDKSMQLALALFGIHAFRTHAKGKRNGPINRAYFEVTTVSFAQLSDADAECLRQNTNLLHENIEALMEDDSFRKALGQTGQSTGHRDNVLRRFSKFQEMLKATLADKQFEVDYDH
jgi:hypothetical protein